VLRDVLLGFAMSLGVTAVSLAADTDYDQQIAQWRSQRVARLEAPDGWLSLIGLEWLKVGTNRIGAAADNDIVLRAGPAKLGTITLATDGSMRIQLDPTSGARIDATDAQQATLVDDAHAGEGAPTKVSFGHANFYVIDREGRKALRVKDADAATRTHFVGLDYFPIDPTWRVVADWVPFDPPHTLQMGNVLGSVDTVDVPGQAVFQRNGHTYELMPYQEEPGGELFFVIADQTSGKQTYGAARFLYAALPKDGKVVLDFNRAYNPPCAFTPYATCPLAPAENRLALAVTAGEKNYRGGHH
jgi:uncharacterized protein (DUF1684 family)